MKNGSLLELAQQEFDVFLTVGEYGIAGVDVCESSENRVDDFRIA